MDATLCSAFRAGTHTLTAVVRRAHLRGKCSFAVFDASRIMFEAADKNYPAAAAAGEEGRPSIPHDDDGRCVLIFSSRL